MPFLHSTWMYVLTVIFLERDPNRRRKGDGILCYNCRRFKKVLRHLKFSERTHATCLAIANSPYSRGALGEYDSMPVYHT